MVTDKLQQVLLAESACGGGGGDETLLSLLSETLKASQLTRTANGQLRLPLSVFTYVHRHLHRMSSVILVVNMKEHASGDVKVGRKMQHLTVL